MTPYIKKIVELHKIHKAIEEKDCCNDGGGTKEITIDDVVKFIHDNSQSISEFPYTKYDDIPELPINSDIDSMRGNIYRTSSFNNLRDYVNECETILYTPSYIIVFFAMGRVG